MKEDRSVFSIYLIMILEAEPVEWVPFAPIRGTYLYSLTPYFFHMSREEQMAISLVDACCLAIQDIHVSGACLD